ncbi:MAG: APC family permease [Arsenophonus sp.]
MVHNISLDLSKEQIEISNRAQLVKKLTLIQVVMMGLAYLQPMTVFDTFCLVSLKTDGHVPSSYIIAIIAILFTVLSYCKLVKRFPSAGLAYTYAQKSISPHIGFMVGWSSLLDYLFMPMINILLAKIYLEVIFPGIAPCIFVIALVLLMTIFNLRGINLVAKLNTIIVMVQITFLLVFLVILIYELSKDESYSNIWSLRPFFSKDAHLIPIITGATILCFSFLGFDGISSLSEETSNAEKVIPKSIFLIVLIAGLIFIGISYFLQMYFPNASYFKKPDESQPEIMLYVAGALFQSVILVFSCITVLASGMASHAVVSRLMYVMGRDGVLSERFFSYVHPRWRTPAFNVILVGMLALTAIWFNVEIATALINFGALITFTFVNISVVSQFYFRDHLCYTWRDRFNYLILPIIGILTMSVLWVNLEKISMLLGTIWATIGIFYMAIITRRFSRPLPQMNNF